MPEPTLKDIDSKLTETKQEIVAVQSQVQALTEIMNRLEATIDKLDKVIVEIRGILPREFVRMGATYRVR